MSEEFEIQRTDYQRTDNRFSGKQFEKELRFGYEVTNPMTGTFHYEYSNEAFERFVNLCETSDYIYVSGVLGHYDRKREEILIRTGYFDETIKIRKSYCEFDGDYWVISPNYRKGNPWRIQFLRIIGY